jgi:high-affinity iron transporter
MFASLLITFRETLEVALVVGILLTFFHKTNQLSYKKYVWYGVGVGILLSIVLYAVLNYFFGGFEGRVEQVFEGILMFVTAGFISWMILWVHRQKGIAKELEQKARVHIENKFPLGITILTITATAREGVETVFYLRAASTLASGNIFLGAVMGMIIAVIFGYLIFRYGMRMRLMQVLKVSGALLLLFAAGLVAHGVHEFQEAGLLPIFSFDPLINIQHILDHQSVFGSILRVLFGYTSKPTLLELLSYGSYVFVIFILEVITTKYLYLKAVGARKSSR